MNRNERVRYEMFVKVREFGGAHREEFPETSAAGKAFAAVTAIAAEIEAQVSATLLTAEERKTVKAAVRQDILERLAAIARTARLVARHAPDSNDMLHLQRPRSDVTLVMAARAVIREGHAAIAPLVPLGLRDTLVTELQTLVDRFEQADRGKRAGKLVRAAAKARLVAAFERSPEPLRTLDVVVANTFANDAAVLTAWKRARRVPSQRASGPSPTVRPPAPVAPADLPAVGQDETIASSAAPTTREAVQRAS